MGQKWKSGTLVFYFLSAGFWKIITLLFWSDRWGKSRQRFIKSECKRNGLANLCRWSAKIWRTLNFTESIDGTNFGGWIKRSLFQWKWCWSGTKTLDLGPPWLEWSSEYLICAETMKRLHPIRVRIKQITKYSFALKIRSKTFCWTVRWCWCLDRLNSP